LKVRGLFPPETDPDISRGGPVDPREMIARFRGDNPQNKLRSHTLDDARKEVALLAAAYDGKANPERVAAFVLDCRYPDSRQARPHN
jgi:hypothetical protein